MQKRFLPGVFGISGILGWLCLRLACPHPLHLDAAINNVAWRDLYAFRLPAALLMLTVVLVNGWWREYSVSSPAEGEATNPAPAAPQSDTAVKRTFGALRAVMASRAVFVFLIATTLLMYRIPQLTGYEYSVDESQSIVAARTFCADPRFWISVDVGTHGPLVSIAQTILVPLGLSIDYAGSRLLGCAMMCAVLLCLYTFLRRVAPDHVARILLLPAVFVNASFIDTDFTAYNGEHPILFLAALAVAAACAGLLPVYEDMGTDKTIPTRPFRPALPWIGLAGVFVGAIPWAKIQGMPIAAVIGTILLIACCLPGVRAVSERRASLMKAAVLTGGALLPLVLIAIVCTLQHSWPAMLNSYIRWNMVYAKRNGGGGLLVTIPVIQGYLDREWPTTSPFAAAMPIAILAGAVALAIISAIRRQVPQRTALALVAGLVTAVCWLCVVLPGNTYPHYLLLLFAPVAGLVGVIWAVAIQSLPVWQPDSAHGQRKLGIPRAILLAAYVVWGIGIPLYQWMGNAFLNDPSLNFSIAPRQSKWDDQDTAFVSRLRVCVRPGERFAIWGWKPKWFVLADRLSTSRNSTSLREAIYDLPMQPYFLHLFLSDFDRFDPPVFVDEMNRKGLLIQSYIAIAGRSMSLPPRRSDDFRYEKFPELAERIRGHYRLLYSDSHGVRLFVRNDRYAEAQALCARLPR